MPTKKQLRAPFPWFGGKMGAAELIWSKLGNVPNYIEPFFGSGAVLLNRPHAPKTETINDLDGFVSNFWRAVAADPEAVARYASWPVVESDLHARHYWLTGQRSTLTMRLEGDPAFYDAQIAGVWAWGLNLKIGSGFCSGEGPWSNDVDEQGYPVLVKTGRSGAGVSREMPHVGNDGCGVHRTHLQESSPAMQERVSMPRELPHLGDAGTGVNRALPHLGNAGTGVNRALPHLGNAGKGIENWMLHLSNRLRRVRVCCGDWSRVLTPSVTTKHGITGVLLDPPYEDGDHDTNTYNHYETGVAGAVREWAFANGNNPLFRIALCSYDNDHPLPDGWEKVNWKARKGYQSVGEDGHHNGKREVILFSPHCLKTTLSLFQ